MVIRKPNISHEDEMKSKSVYKAPVLVMIGNAADDTQGGTGGPAQDGTLPTGDAGS